MAVTEEQIKLIALLPVVLLLGTLGWLVIDEYIKRRHTIRKK